ncbi:DUF3221 domain-containing protein [Anaerosoma tenue]|uniref:DUF3221 domain-containing protein n=1 Tax=Anaerosoma tenue TaxID=2933588 RepID=UPI002260E37C|nr:DUF3221 domain-containing protein [Anaerosoma tenue]MCK8114806.1 YobA family protein [Anaerosoma tenue]
MKRIGWVIVAVAAGLALAGCATSAPEPPSTEPDIRGVVTSVSDAGDGASFRVVWMNDDAVGAQEDYDAAQVTANAATEILTRAADGSVTDAAVDDIAVGTVVEAWFEGPVAESYPVQATAGAVVILGSYSGELPEPPGLQ